MAIKSLTLVFLLLRAGMAQETTSPGWGPERLPPFDDAAAYQPLSHEAELVEQAFVSQKRVAATRLHSEAKSE